MAKYNLKSKSTTLTLWILMLVFMGPSLIAATLYLYREYIPFKTLEKGKLLSPPVAAETLPFFKTTFIGKWQLIYVSQAECDATCQTPLSLLAKLHNALGKDQYRVQYRAVPSPLIPVLKQGDIAIMDPRGWLIMQYAPPADPLNILKDLRRLLRLSHVG